LRATFALALSGYAVTVHRRPIFGTKADIAFLHRWGTDYEYTP
jgi:hypothetical protein